MIQDLNSKSAQVLENLTGIALGNGFVLPGGTDRKTWVTQKLVPNPEQDKYLTSFFESLLETERIRDYFVTQLKKTLNPKIYGIDRVWKLTQREALEAVIRSFEGWHTRPLIELPTGVGKSMLEGAIARAYYDTLCVFGLEDLFEIIICTSRIHIGDQMINKTNSTKNEEDDDDTPLEYGDVKMWFPFLKKKKPLVRSSCNEGWNVGQLCCIYYTTFKYISQVINPGFGIESGITEE